MDDEQELHNEDSINVLVVDDTQTNIIIMEHILSKLPINIHSVQSGQEAIQLILENQYAVVYLDVQMPEMDGYEVARILSEDKKTAGVPIVFVTAADKNDENIKLGYEAGAIDYLSKPVDPDVLVAKTKIFMRLFEQQEKLSKLVSKLDDLATTDALTGLSNRYQFNYIFEKVLENNKRHSREFAFMIIDVDGFKMINDSYGHDIGDELLKQIAERIHTSVRSSDHVSRLGGDEFAILLTELASSTVTGSIAKQLIERLCDPFKIGTLQLQISVSIGIALYPFASDTVEGLFKAADIALYRVKEKGKNNFEYYTDSMNVAYQRRAVIESALLGAIENNEIYLVYQPRINMQTGQVVGVEALARWTDDKLGEVLPDEFIRVAEDMGVIHKLGYSLMSMAFSQFEKWQHSHDYSNFGLAINLSPYQILNQSFVGSMKKLIAQYSVDLNYVEFELTESIFKGDDEHLELSLKEVKELGISFAIDDFGTGCSSLSRLKSLPIHVLKIDQSFIRGITTDGNDAAIVRAVILLAGALQLDVVAEGVETKEQADFLLKNGCLYAQGYYYSKPVSADEIEKLIS
jgi:diguanylate cyclase (GGDEF)-like protein